MRKRFNRSVKICFNYVEKAKRTPKQAGSIHGDPSERTTRGRDKGDTEKENLCLRKVIRKELPKIPVYFMEIT